MDLAAQNPAVAAAVGLPHMSKALLLTCLSVEHQLNVELPLATVNKELVPYGVNLFES
jgi:hypothetical protein